MKSPRRLVSRKTIYNGRIFRVERHLVRFGTGRTIPMEVVRHRGSVVLMPQPAPGKIVLIRQFRYVIGQWIWELPAGSLEQGEAPGRAARRECLEETGLRPKTLRRLGMFYPTPGFCDEKMIFYACTDLVRPSRPVEGDPDEEIEPRTFTLKEAWALVGRGDIIDMKTILGLVMLDRPAMLKAPKPRRPARPR